MNSFSEPDLERVLRRAPVPPPSAALRSALEQDLDRHLPPTTAPETSVRSPRRFHGRSARFRLWIPLSGLFGALVTCLCVFAWINAASSDVFAETWVALERVKSFRVVERTRAGPPHRVIKDPSKTEPFMWPNYGTSRHPANPLVETVHWFAADPTRPGSGFTRSVSPERETWRARNVELVVDRGTGARRLSLSAGERLFASISAVPGALASADGAREVHVAGAPDDVVVYEKRHGSENDDPTIFRLWVDRGNRLPRRLQILSPAFPEHAPEVLLQEYEFLDYDAEFPADTFAFDVTDDDLRQLGLDRAAWTALAPDAVSFHLDGPAGLEIRGTLKDRSGTRSVSGRLPFAFVHAPRGTVAFRFGAADGKPHALRLRVNSADMGTTARRLSGELSESGVFVQGDD